MAEAVQPSLPMVPNMENARKIRDVMLEKVNQMKDLLKVVL